MKKTLTCIVCPMGCNLEIELKDNKVMNVAGNTCKRGEEYAISECTNPVRTVTSVVRCSNGDMLSVKTDSPIPKNKINDCMQIINSAHPDLPISIGDVIIKDVFGCNIVATQNKFDEE